MTYDNPSLDANKAWMRVMPRDCPGCGRRMFTCGRTCPVLLEIERAHQADQAWFEEHPDERERLRPYTVAEQVGVFVTSGKAVGHYVRVTWGGRWWPYKPSDGPRPLRMLHRRDAVG